MEGPYTTVKLLGVQPDDAWQCATCGIPAQESEFAACVEHGDRVEYVCGQCIAHSIVALLHSHHQATDQAE